MTAPTRELTDKDAAEWARFAGRIARLRKQRDTAQSAVPVPEAPPGAARKSAMPDTPAIAARQPARSPAHPSARSATRSTALGIGGQPPGVDTATWQRFHRGRVGGVRKLDLHGMTARHAFATLRAFLHAAQADRVRCVEIVTGRGDADGSGVLRRELPLWLNLPEIRPMVLAAAHPYTSSAMHSHAANPGSVRLLLRRPRA